YLFFFSSRRRHTRFSRDWSSDVCSSDLSINILQASLLAMSRAAEALSHAPGFIYVDGLHCPRWRFRSAALVNGDARMACIAAASILAKVTRDREMLALDTRYPGYGFAAHNGYPSP